MVSRLFLLYKAKAAVFPAALYYFLIESLTIE